MRAIELEMECEECNGMTGVVVCDNWLGICIPSFLLHLLHVLALFPTVS
jgi:hypothetical protein